MFAQPAMKTAARRWLSDPSTYPIMGIIACAVSGATYQVARYSLHNPDVQFRKQKRESIFHFNAAEGEAWRQHRFRFANAQRNPINQSEQFDDLFAKPENQNVTR